MYNSSLTSLLTYSKVSAKNIQHRKILEESKMFLKYDLNAVRLFPFIQTT